MARRTSSTPIRASSTPRPIRCRFFPAPGRDETGVGNIFNSPLAAGDGGANSGSFRGPILPALNVFEPELIIVSAGFDAHDAIRWSLT